MGGRWSRLGLLPTANWREMLRAVVTFAGNYDLSNEDIVAWLETVFASDPFELAEFDGGTLRARFLAPVKDPAALAGAIHAFCPDVVDQGTGTVEAMAGSLMAERALFLWWHGGWGRGRQDDCQRRFGISSRGRWWTCYSPIRDGDPCSRSNG